MKIVTTIMQIAVHGEDVNPVFGEGVIYVGVTDDAGGPYITLTQPDTNENGVVRLDYKEIDAISEAAKMLMHQMYIEKAALECNVI